MKFKKSYNKTREFVSGKIMSKGIEIGYVKNLKNNKEKKIKNSILLQDEFLTSDNITEITNSLGIILTKDGYSSCFANILRKFQKPSILLKETRVLNDLMNRLIVIDAFTGRIYLWRGLNYKERSFYFWKYLNHKAGLKNLKFEKWFGIKNIKNTVRYEQVFFDINKNEIIETLKGLNATRIFDGIQNIITYDYKTNPLIDDNIIFRIQYTDKDVWIQMKKLYNVRDKYRKEEESLIIFNTLKDAINFMKCKGSTKTGYQERKITSYELDKVIFNIIEWPNNSSIYLGVEADSTDKLDIYRKKAKLNYEDGVYTDGKKIFKKLNLTLNNCKFQK